MSAVAAAAMLLLKYYDKLIVEIENNIKFSHLQYFMALQKRTLSDKKKIENPNLTPKIAPYFLR